MRLATILWCALAASAHAAGTETDSTPPPPPACDQGLVRDAETGLCVAPQDSRLDDDERYAAMRALAYAGQIDHAIAVLGAMTDQRADRVLTYRGFTARQQGDMETALRWYRAALLANPDNLLARSYMGQAFVETGNNAAARAELSEIRRRGGRGTWPETALRLAIGSGRGVSY